MKFFKFAPHSLNRNYILQVILSRFKQRAGHWKSGVLLMCSLSLAACGGSGSSDEKVSTGVFIDSAVEGLHYETATRSGTTNSLGEYDYLPGETVTFSIGGIVLGSTAASPVVTPLSLVAGATNASDPVVTNIVRLLLSLDSDDDPGNGITISSDVTTAAAGLTVDFGAADLSADEGITGLLSSVSGFTLVDATTAQAHFNLTLAALAKSTWGTLQWGSSTWRSVSQ